MTHVVGQVDPQEHQTVPSQGPLRFPDGSHVSHFCRQYHSQLRGSAMSALWQQGMSPEAWADIFYTTFTTVRTAVLTPLIMLVVFVVLRLAGQRSLTEQTLFNRLTLVALGSLVSSAALRPNTPLASVVICTVVIVVVNLAVNEGYARGWIPHDVLRSHPILLWVNGRFIDENMQHCQLTRDKFNSELRQQGYISLATVFAVTLEPPGKVAVITQSAVRGSGDWELFKDVRGYDEHLLHLQHNRWPASAGHTAPKHTNVDSLSEPLLPFSEEYHSPPSSHGSV